MSFRFYFFFILVTGFFLFYPGTHPYLQIIAFNRSQFLQKELKPSINIKPIPYTINTPDPNISANGVYVVEIDSFTPIYEKNSRQKFFPASTAKIVAALVATDLYQPESIVKIKRVKNEGQVMELVPGENITVENLLYGVLVHSGNDAAYALADDFGFDQFVAKMNAKAAALGMKDSHFTNPAGLDNSSQKTTPFDLALAGRALIENPYLRKMVGTKEIIISDTEYSIFHKLTNVNKLLGEIQGLGGLKTGYTENAGENLISFYKHNDHDYIVVVMNSEDRFVDTRLLIDWIKAYVQYASPNI